MAMLMGRPVDHPWSCFDSSYEFCAPHFFDFFSGETDAQKAAAESWFEIAAGYDPSPYCSNSSSETVEEPSQAGLITLDSTQAGSKEINLKLLVRLDNHEAEAVDANPSLDASPYGSPKKDDFGTLLPERYKDVADSPVSRREVFPVKRIRLEEQEQKQQVKKLVKRHVQNATRKKKTAAKQQQQQPVQTPQGNPRKKQKLDGGLQKQVHKSTPALTVPRAFQLSTEKRAQMHRKGDYGTVSKMGELCSSFVSVAEQVQRFFAETPERFKKPSNKSKLTLSKPKEPELETSYRSRPPKVKSTAELEEEMLSKLPKFKARPANKKILEASTLPALPKSTPQLPQFQEFNLKTMERALQHTSQKVAEQTSAISERKRQRRKSAPGAGDFQISERVKSRPKSTQELEEEEMAKVPKFRALPLNKKIFESQGDLGILRHQKRQVTVPVEFKFATNERFSHQLDSLIENFRRLSLDSHPNPDGRKTIAQPFHLLTEERGSAKMAKFMQELSRKMLSDSMARVPKANLLPLTTDVPMVPPKPVQKPSTRPEPFRLESLLRHEQEIQRLADERAREEELKAELAKFRAQPVACNVPVFVPQRSRKPLTEIKEFSFQVEHRAVQRAAFEKKILEKQNLYKQYKEELEAARKEEEEKFVRALRKEMIPQARPMPLFDRPFVPQRSMKSLTLPVSPQLHLPRTQRAEKTEGPFCPHRKFRLRKVSEECSSQKSRPECRKL